MKRLVSLVAGVLLLVTSTAAAPVGPPAGLRTYYGDLYHRETGSLNLVLRPGVRYTYRGSCDAWCGDLDFALYEWVPADGGRRGYWKLRVADRAANDTPLVWVIPDHEATYRLDIIMATCNDEPCGYNVDLSW